MNKLTAENFIKHLPYGVKVPSSLKYNYGGVRTDAEYLTINGIRDNYISFEGIGGFYPIEHFKPCLFHLNSLTKTITISGKEFVPIDEFEIGDGDDNGIEYNNGNIRLIKDLEAISAGSLYQNIHFLPYSVVNKLIEWHFDIDNLLEQKLAFDADINNPYKYDATINKNNI